MSKLERAIFGSPKNVFAIKFCGNNKCDGVENSVAYADEVLKRFLPYGENQKILRDYISSHEGERTTMCGIDHPLLGHIGLEVSIGHDELIIMSDRETLTDAEKISICSDAIKKVVSELIVTELRKGFGNDTDRMKLVMSFIRSGY